MYGHIMLLAAFFMESQPPTGTIMIVVINFEFQDCAHTGEAVEHRGDERQVPQAGHRVLRNRIQQRLGVFATPDWRFAFLNDILWTANGMCRIRPQIRSEKISMFNVFIKWLSVFVSS